VRITLDAMGETGLGRAGATALIGTVWTRGSLAARAALMAARAAGSPITVLAKGSGAGAGAAGAGTAGTATVGPRESGRDSGVVTTGAVAERVTGLPQAAQNRAVATRGAAHLAQTAMGPVSHDVSWDVQARGSHPGRFFERVGNPRLDRPLDELT
jgi:hypothetical protein